MSTDGFENCVSGTFYGFTDSENNEFHPGDTFNLQWGAIDGGNTPLNISLGRAGGTLIDKIVAGASFSTSSSLYRLVVNDTANCTLEQYSWAIPADFNTTNPQYQVGLFDASAKLGTAGVALYGWKSWSPYFYVREKSTTTTSTTATGTSATALLTGTGESAPSGVTATSTSTSTSSGSNSSKIGIGVGVGVGGAAVILLLLFAVYFLRRRRRANPQEGAPAPIPETMSMAPAELPAVELPGNKKQQRNVLYEMQG
ncbi:uncharacterized protein CDV56_101347 [Aspergillus thermomutatus]|uniref:Mid2 domain-containing protein n=1 Tax=Aspergillus thermomutatus TaxID=41047 RepID=A0A397H3G8_ASPTH|nr:uncharacterized protein CDV56_101347 [Aspergillus thermomutatus]RHZ57665.1 hypothetical protein CDV56_101347 [Aspergillus thermomutatus]